MQKNEKKYLIGRIKEVISEFSITAYEVAKHTSLTEVGIAKILNGKVKNPNDTSIRAIMQYLNEYHQINLDWLHTGDGLMKDITIPKPIDFSNLTESQKKRKLDELAVFIAHHEDIMMENPIFKSLVQRIGYQMVLKELKDERVD